MMSFSAECGHPKGLGVLLRSSDANAWHGHHLAVPYALIGSGTACNIRLPDDSLADCHVYLQAVEERLFVCDLTGNQSLRAGCEQVDSVWLELPADFHLGRYVVRVAGVDEDGDEDHQLPPIGEDLTEGEEEELHHPTEVSVELRLRRGAKSGAAVRSRKQVSLIGASALCKFCVHTASRGCPLQSGADGQECLAG